MAANERTSLLSTPHTPVFMTTFNSTSALTERESSFEAAPPPYEAPPVPPAPPPLPRPPSVAAGQFPVSQRFEKRSVLLDVDITFEATSRTTLNLPPPRKLRLQVSPGDSVAMLSPLILRRVKIPQPFTFFALIAFTPKGYELEDTDPVGEVADRGDHLCA